MPRSSIKMLGKPAIGEILHAGQELDNAVGKFAVKVVKTMKQLVIYHTSTRKFCGHGTWRKNYCKRMCVGMDIPYRLLFSC